MNDDKNIELEDTMSSISEITPSEETVDTEVSDEIEDEIDDYTENEDDGDDGSNKKKNIIIIILLIVVVIIVFVALISSFLSLIGKKDKKENSTSNKNNPLSDSNVVIDHDSNSNSNEINDNPDYEIIATFYGNGATLDKYEAMCVTENKEDGCEISMPDIKRDGATILGFSADKNAKSGTISANSKITIKDDVTYYAITKKTITATFTYPRGEKANQTQKCTVYNENNDCKVTFPSYISKGAFQDTWSSKKDLKGTIYFSGKTTTIHNNTTFYAAYHHPYWSDSSSIENYHKDRNLNIVKVVNVGNTRFEYESGIPEYAISNHIKFINTAYSKTPWIFTPGKVFVLTPATYLKISFAYGLTFGEGHYNYIDIQYDESIDKIDENATIHELAHAWDFYYEYKKGNKISSQADIQKLYNSLTSEQRRNLSALEWFAGTSTEYYWHYLGMNPEADSYAGYKDLMSEQQQKEYVALYEKYVKISQNGYK